MSGWVTVRVVTHLDGPPGEECGGCPVPVGAQCLSAPWGRLGDALGDTLQLAVSPEGTGRSSCAPSSDF